MKTLVSVFASLLLGASVSRAETLVAPCVADTSLDEINPDNSLGAEAHLLAGANSNRKRTRALLRFDFSKIPKGVKIESAELKLTVVGAPSGGGAASTMELRRMKVAWVEGTKTGKHGQGAADGETSWNHRLIPDELWTVAGGKTPEDFEVEPSGEAKVQGLGPVLFASTARMTADARSWMENPSENFGWMLLSRSEDIGQTARRFGSREAAAAELAPRLTITYAADGSQSVTLTPAADTGLHEEVKEHNSGGGTHVAIGTNLHAARNRGLFRFDLSGKVPPNAKIESAALTFRVTGIPMSGAENSSFAARRMLIGWTEGIQIGNLGTPAEPGEPTWSKRVFPDVDWGEPGAGSDSDASATNSGEVAVEGVGKYTIASTAGMVADVQAWVNEPAKNFGWMLLTKSEDIAGTARRVGSRESDADAPSLAITFSPGAPAAAPIRLLSFLVEKGEVALAWEGGRPPYQVFASPDLAPSSWKPLGQAGPLKLGRFPLSGPRRFFRVGPPEKAP